MKLTVPFLIVCLTCPALPEECEVHGFVNGNYRPAGWPETTPKLLVLAEQPVCIEFRGPAADGTPLARLDRITSARRISLDAGEAKPASDGWQWTWTPPKTRGPAQYEVRFDCEPLRIVRIESRDPVWFKTTMEMLAKADWQSLCLTGAEIAALNHHGIRVASASATTKDAPASLLLFPKHGETSRRRVVWDSENPHLVVWRSGPASGDLEARAPRWWISPEALATRQGLIRFLDLFTEPPAQP